MVAHVAGLHWMQKKCANCIYILQEHIEMIMGPMLTILVVDDEPAIVDSLTRLLHGAGYLVVSAADGRQALETLDLVTIDLLLSDVSMPVLSGWELYSALRADHRYRRLPIVLMTIAPSRSLNEAYPDVTFLRKPLQDHQVLEAIARQLA